MVLLQTEMTCCFLNIYGPYMATYGPYMAIYDHIWTIYGHMWPYPPTPWSFKGSSGVCSTIWSSTLISDCWFDPQLWSLIADLPQFQFQCWNLWPLGVESRGPKGVSICRGGSPTFWEKGIIFLNSFLGQLVCDLKSFLGPSGRPCGTQKAQHGQPLTFPMSIWKVNVRWILTIFNLVFFFQREYIFKILETLSCNIRRHLAIKVMIWCHFGTPWDDPLEHPWAP